MADGHLTPEPIENIYSGVVSQRNLRLVIFLGKLNHLDLWGADIGNAYLEAFTDEKLYIVAGPEFQELEGYILMFLKALYGLKSSGKRWAEVIHGILRDMKFLPSKADPCIWLRKAPNLKYYEYIAVYVNDLCIAAESSSAIVQIFKSKYHLKVKGDGKLTYHLGADYFEDPDGTFVSQPKKYIDKLADTYKKLFNEDPPKGYKTPLDINDHPELDTSEILEGDMAAKYLTMWGQLQGLVTLGRFDIHAQVATMSRFRAALGKDIWTDSRGFAPMPLGLRNMQLGLELINLTIPFYLIKILIGHTLYMVMSKKSFLMTCQIHLARQ